MLHKIAVFLALSCWTVLGLNVSAETSPIALKITSYSDTVRFTADSSVKAMRVEIISLAGHTLFESQFAAKASLDWQMLDFKGHPIADGVYLYTVTVKDASGKISQQVGKLAVVRRLGQLAPALTLPTTVGELTRIQSPEARNRIFWAVTGNAVTNPTTNFLGTTDNVALEIRVNNQRALRIEPGCQTVGPGCDPTTSVPNLIGGSSFNFVAPGPEGNPTTIGATIGGGGGNQVANSVTGNFGTVGGGVGNRAWRSTSTVGGGNGNNAVGAGSVVAGGLSNGAGGVYSVVPGGSTNEAQGDFSFAAGHRAKVNGAHDGSFLFADQNDFDFNSAAANEFAVRATGGVRFVSGIDGSGNPNAGVQLAAGGGSWSSLSDRNAKANFAAVDGRTILAKLASIPMQTWNYKSQDATIRHIGPMAQDFYAAFGLGEDNKHITTIDADGVSLASIQALYELSLEKDRQITELQQRLEKLERLVKELTRK